MSSPRPASNARLPSYGGQAVIEGVMMRGTQVCATAVRAPNGSIVVEARPLSGLYRGRVPRVPFVRGFLAIVDALVLGMRALAFSAGVQAGEGAAEAPIAVWMLVSLLVGVGVFFLLPAAAASLAGNEWGWNDLQSNAVEGLVRLGLLVGYVGAIGRWPEARRVYAYHGAEHKTIHAYEAGAPLEPAAISTFPREHPRCGTAFLLTVVVISILVFTLLGPMPLLPRLVSRILLLPVIASLAYEYIRLTGRWAGTAWGRLLAAPNLAIQRLTTREPTTDMIDVAVAAFEAMRREEPGAMAREP